MSKPCILSKYYHGRAETKSGGAGRFVDVSCGSFGGGRDGVRVAHRRGSRSAYAVGHPGKRGFLDCSDRAH